MSFGLLATGFNPERLEDCKADIESGLKTAYGANTRIVAESVIGQLIGIMAEKFADLWAQADGVYGSAYVNGAASASLDDLLALAGKARLGATFSRVLLTLGGTNGTAIPTGSIAQDPIQLIRWITLSDVTISGGTATVYAQPATPGPILGIAGTINDIVTAITGWTTVTNVHDAVPGRNVETDAAARERFLLSFFSGGGSSVDAIRSVLLGLVDVSYVNVVENDGSGTDSEGRPPHSLEAIVVGAADQDVINALWASKPAGIKAYGYNVTGNALDSTGLAHAVGFTRPLPIDVYITVEYSRLADAPADLEALIETEILAYGTSLAVGQDVIPFQIVQHIETEGIESLTLKIDASPSPTTTTPLAISRRQHAVFDSTRIVFVEV